MRNNILILKNFFNKKYLNIIYKYLKKLKDKIIYIKLF